MRKARTLASGQVFVHDFPVAIDAAEDGGPGAADDVRLVVGRDVRHRPGAGQNCGIIRYRHFGSHDDSVLRH